MSSSKRTASRQRAIIKACILLTLVIVAFVTALHIPLKHYLTLDVLGSLLETTGFWAPIVFILIYTVGVTLFIPAIIFTVLGTVFFGIYWGFFYVMMGSMSGASLSFFIARHLGRGFVEGWMGDRLRKYDEAIEKHGFTTVFYLRLLYSPFAPVNFGMGLSKIGFWDFFSGTGLGILVETFLFISLFASLEEIWSTGNWHELLSLRFLPFFALFILSFFIPRIMKKLNNCRFKFPA
ncbi:TVP38/TMEM64 family protein [Desulforhabdus amnigena]|jgi:uncharacterized membrane protein YdjX (TVP38/TMEM64 family)|uniref:TVP38/TMEM64 family membrane protein n=1 Tax=Desulforhabdus amnigena TaxID=40218 RepID=A0A9W6CZF4_9BACT|nr:VTT domain-containing protein [Desulforhabdus amnigena]NLJ27738.1 TVP38/TMEM64 family protein [Deltaproteobacteria bacterium]GLI32970.1 hypothetical protein DAMNIGENAA_04030 [Desulforhabdus amnigena]